MENLSTHDNPTIGIEFELLFRNGIQGIAEHLGVKQYGYCDSTNGDENALCVSWDGSVGSAGGEVKFTRPFKYSEINPLINQMVLLANHPDAKFGYTRVTKLDPKYLQHEKVLLHTDTGVHIHFGLPKEYTPLNVFAFIRSMRKYENNLIKFGYRKCNRWARGSQMHINTISKSLDNVNRRYQNGVILPISPKVGNRYYGINLTNIGKPEKNTIEVRFPHSTLMMSRENITSYIKLIKDFWEEAFDPNKKECRWGNKYVMKYDVFDEVLSGAHVINLHDRKTDKFLGKFKSKI